MKLAPMFEIVPNPVTREPGFKQLKLPEKAKSEFSNADSTKGYPNLPDHSRPNMSTLLKLTSDRIEGTLTEVP